MMYLGNLKDEERLNVNLRSSRCEFKTTVWAVFFPKVDQGHTEKQGPTPQLTVSL